MKNCQYCGEPSGNSYTCDACSAGWPNSNCRCENNGDYCPACEAWISYRKAVASKSDNWVPACGGMEQPFRSRSGIWLIYVFQPSTGKHAYLNLGTDIILTDEEAAAALGR